MPALRIAAATLAATLPLCLLTVTPASAATTPVLTVAGVPLEGATVSSNAVVQLTVSSPISSVRWILDGAYVGKDSMAPFEIPVPAAAGNHRVKARADAAGTTTTYTADFIVGAVAGSPSPTPSPVAAPAPSPTPSPAPSPTPSPSPSPSPLVTAPAITGPTPVRVSTADQLTKALAAARPGTVIDLADGTYSGRFRASAAGEPSAPIVLRGSRRAVLSGGSTSSGYALHLDGARYWVLEGFTVTGGQKGIVLDRTNHTVLRQLDVGRTGHEAVHFRSFSSDNTLADSLVHHTGLVTASYGEGVYIGSAVSNWDRYSGGVADRSDRNSVLRNKVWATTAESVDVKEGSTGGIIDGNSFEGSAITGAGYADSWLDVKGNGYQIRRNTGSNAPLDGFQTHVVVTGWGQGNTFTANVLAVNGPGYGVRIQNPSGSRNRVACDNVATAARGLSNVVCG